MPAEAVLSALHALLKTLQPLRLPVALLGGLALAVWKHPRFTRDVDVLVALGEVSTGQLVDVLRPAGFRPKRGDGLVKLGELELLQLLYEPADALVAVQVDLLLARDAYQSGALTRRVHVDVSEFGLQIDVLACEDLIINKLAAGRMIDLADAAALIRANRNSLDLRYLLHWIDEKHLNAEFAQTWQEAFPDEHVPGRE